MMPASSSSSSLNQGHNVNNLVSSRTTSSGVAVGRGEGRDNDNEEEMVSQLTDNEKEKEIHRVYRTNDMIEEDRGTLLLVKEKAKEVIWPYTKFGNLDVWNDIDMFDEGTVLHRILESMNLLHYDRITRVRFWLRYCRVVYDALSVHKAIAGDGIRKNMKKGIEKCVCYDFLTIFITFYY